MKTEKLYFENIDATFCSDLQTLLEDAKVEGLKEITLVEADPETDGQFVWCTHEGEVTERDMCRKVECHLYSSKSGRGVCKHRGKLYRHGNEVKFKVET